MSDTNYPESREALEDSWMFTDRTNNSIKDYPGEVDGEYLIGVDNGGGWYYHPARKIVRSYRLNNKSGDGPRELSVGFVMNSREFEESHGDISSLAKDLVDRTVFGHAMVVADELSDASLTKAQAKAYALRDIYGVGRSQTATLLNKSPNTVDNQRAQANRKVSDACKLANVVKKYATRQ